MTNMLKFDYHTHTSHSHDSSASINDMIEKAIELKLTEYAITDHIDFSYPDLKILSPQEPEIIMQSMLAAKERYDGKIKILCGAEFGLRPDTAKVTEAIAEKIDYDIIIGSAHVDDIQLEGFHSYQFSSHYDKHTAYTIYFENMLETVKSCDAFDVLGHMDYIKRYARYSDNSLEYDDYKEIIDEILKVIIRKDKGIEINTSGYFRGLGHPHPQIEFIKRYIQLGGAIITIGSDAHKPSAIAYGYDAAYDILRNLGIRYIAAFDKRIPKFIKI